MSASPWTPARDAELRRLWETGLSASKIAAQMGLTKGAVIGRAHRMGMPQRKPVVDPAKSGRRPSKARHRPSPPCSLPIAEEPAAPASAPAAPDPRHLLDPRVSSIDKCRFIIGPTSGPSTIFCAAVVDRPGLSSWCAEHRATCFVQRPAPTGRPFLIGDSRTARAHLVSDRSAA